MTDEVANDRLFSEYFGCTLPVSFHHCYILIFIYTMYLPDKRAKPGNVPIKSNVLSDFGERWTEKYFYSVLKSLNNTSKA